MDTIYSVLFQSVQLDFMACIVSKNVCVKTTQLVTQCRVNVNALPGGRDLIVPNVSQTRLVILSMTSCTSITLSDRLGTTQKVLICQLPSCKLHK